jgi:signal transduction histidine kinase
MTNAQEADRSRIARELHDDIGQGLAVLKNLDVTNWPASFGPSCRLHPSIRDLVVKLDAISRKVSDLSHNLHSTKLESLGLAVAAQAQCRERSSQLRLPISCTCSEIQERLDGMVALAFLRMVQEALHNILKHSRATNTVARLTGFGQFSYLSGERGWSWF